MCFFPRPNTNFKSISYRKGLTSFECGTCPECLKKRASGWVLRCVYEARSRLALGQGCCMVTLTYDSFKRDNKGNIIFDTNGVPLENPVDSSLVVDKRDVQLFIKRLRSHFKNKSIKYLVSAEYGSKTHRAHYHALLFGVDFNDVVPYKRSARGKQLYWSPTLFKLWKHGICTIDSLTVSASTAAYCTKYAMKNAGVQDTFMLVSQGIGISELYKNFTGRPYVIDGRLYPVPRKVWELYITDKYGSDYFFDTRYRDKLSPEYEYFKEARSLYRAIRDSDPVYSGYLSYWQSKTRELEFSRPSRLHRLVALPDFEYHFYKVKALPLIGSTFSGYNVAGYVLDPRASLKRVQNYNDVVSQYFHTRISKRVYNPFINELSPWESSSLAVDSCHNTASDSFCVQKSLQLCYEFKNKPSESLDNVDLEYYNLFSSPPPWVK